MADRHNRDIDREFAPLPEPLPIAVADAHAHIEIVTNDTPDSEAVRKVLDDAKSVGVDRIVQVGYSAEQSEWCCSQRDCPLPVMTIYCHDLLGRPSKQ